MVLAGQRLPHQPLGLAAAQLDHVRSRRVDRDAAVEPVAAEVGEAPAPPGAVERVEQGRARVLGVGAGDHGAVPGERGGALAVQVVVGEQVERDARRASQSIRIRSWARPCGPPCCEQR